MNRLLAIGAAVVVIAGGCYAIISASSGSSSAGTSSGAPAKTGSGARSGPAAGGAAGTVTSTSTSDFTLSTSAGQKVTVKSADAGAIKTGDVVIALGTTSGTTITATQVVAQPTGGSGSYSPSKVVPFERGAPSPSKQDGQIPADYKQGSGTIVGGTTANAATKAALIAYPGGVVDRVVKLSDGEYEVHNIGVNWPHHIFVDGSFKVVGAN